MRISQGTNSEVSYSQEIVDDGNSGERRRRWRRRRRRQRVVHRNIVSTRKIRTSRRSLLFTSPVPPCCIAAGCSPGKENYTGRLTCRFCAASTGLGRARSRQSSSDTTLTNIKFINGTTKVVEARQNEMDSTRERSKI